MKKKRMSHMIRKTTRMVANKIMKETTTVIDKMEMKISHKKEVMTMRRKIMMKKSRRTKMIMIMMVMPIKMQKMMDNRRFYRISRVQASCTPLLTTASNSSKR